MISGEHTRQSGDLGGDPAGGTGGGPRAVVVRSLTGLFGSQRGLILGVLVALFVIFTAASPADFLTGFNMLSLLTATAVLLILATGQTFVLITAGVDLSVGSVLVFSGVLAAKTMVAFGGVNASWAGVVAGIAVGVAAGAAWGSVNGFLVAWARIPPLIVTLGTLGAALGLAEVISGGNDIFNIPNHLINAFGTGDIIGIPVFVWITAVIVILAAVMLNMTRFGRHTLAIGASQEAAIRAGINVRIHLLKVYAYQGTLAGIAGILSLARFSNTTISGHATDNLAAITAAVVGGTSLFGGYGTIFGTVIGAFIPVILLNGLTIVNINSFWQQVVVGAILIIAVWVDQRRRQKAAR
jgi:ribose transport system permease protein